MHTDKPIRAGVLFSASGPTSVTESSMINATLFAIGEVNEAGGINGRELVPVLCDPAGDPAAYSQMASQLLAESDVRVIFGCYMSNSRKAALKSVERGNGLLCYPAQYEGFEYSRNAIYCGAVPNQNSAYLGRYLLEHVGTQFYMVGSDYIWPRESDRIMSEMISAHGGGVVGRGYLKMNAPAESYLPLALDIKRKGPDVIFGNFVGDSIVHFYRALAESGLDARQIPVASLTTSEVDVQAMGISAAVGHITGATYFQSQQNPNNLRCVKRYQALYGDQALTNMCWEAAYAQVHIVAGAMARCNTDEPNILRSEILGAKFDAPQGPVQIDRLNAHMHVWPKIGKVQQDGQFEILATSKHAVPPEPYQVSHDETDQPDMLTLK